MRSMRRVLAILVTLLSTGLVACNSHLAKSELIGHYVMEMPGRKVELTLSPNGAFTQKVVFRDGIRNASGEWEFTPRPATVVLKNGLEVDSEREAITVNVLAMAVSKQWGRVYLEYDPDHEYRFQKDKDNGSR